MVIYNKVTSDPPRPHVSYSSVSVTVSGNAVDFSIKDNTSLFDRLTYGREVVVRNTYPVLLKLNEQSNDPIELYSYEGISTSGIPISDILITTTASGSRIRVWILGWN
jgi:hypothetical protein